MPVLNIQSNTPSPFAPLAAARKSPLVISFNPADTNQDGMVSPAERLAYELSHPAANLASRPQSSATRYTQKGTLNPTSFAPLPSTTKGPSFASLDPADRNQDGLVSSAEQFAYELSHPAATFASRLQSSATRYTQKGGLQMPIQISGRFLDLNT